jgi:hypothetical protein
MILIVGVETTMHQLLVQTILTSAIGKKNLSSKTNNKSHFSMAA